MKLMSTRLKNPESLWSRLSGLSLGSLCLIFTVMAQAAGQPVITVEASKFKFSPNVIKLKQGETATLELVTKDRLHGFAVPDMNIRSDIEPGQRHRVTIKADKPGKYVFLCDLFCGEGHGKMHGVIEVLPLE